LNVDDCCAIVAHINCCVFLAVQLAALSWSCDRLQLTPTAVEGRHAGAPVIIMPQGGCYILQNAVGLCVM